VLSAPASTLISLFSIGAFLALPVMPVFAFFLRRVFARYDVTVIGNGRFIYFPAIPEFITGKKNQDTVTLDIRPWLWRRNVHFVNDMVVDVQDGGRTVLTTQGRYSNDALFIGTGPAVRLNKRDGFVAGRGTQMYESACLLDYALKERDIRDADGTFTEADLVLFTPGIRAPDWVQQSCLPMSAGGHIDVDKFGRVKGLNNVFASGVTRP
jgi:sulfide:quinone oxidoreductase